MADYKAISGHEEIVLILTRSRVCKRLGISRHHFLKLVKTGQLEAVQYGDAPNSPYRVSEEALAEFIKKSKVKAGTSQ